MRRSLSCKQWGEAPKSCSDRGAPRLEAPCVSEEPGDLGEVVGVLVRRLGFILSVVQRVVIRRVQNNFSFCSDAILGRSPFGGTGL